MRNLPLLFLMLIGLQMVDGQNLLDINPGARGGGFGGTKGAHHGILSMYGNDAGLAYIPGWSMYASAENRFSTVGLKYYSFLAAYPTAFGAWGGTVQYGGIDSYNELLAGVTYARKLWDWLSVGSQFNLQQVRIPTYGNSSTFTVELGALYQIHEAVRVGIHINNPFYIKYSEELTIPRVWILALQYQPSNKVQMVSEIEKTTSLRENIKFGVEYLLIQGLAIRTGFQTSPALFTFGVGFDLGENFTFDFASSYHQELGLSPMGGVGYQKIRE